MLPGKSHVRIAGIDYVIDESVDGHYEHNIDAIAAGRQRIVGTPLAENVRPEKLFWAIDDWSGGEGAYVFDPRDPTVYDYSTGLNGRIRGQLTGRPLRDQTQVTAMGDNNQRCYLALSQGIVYIGCDEKIKQSTDYGATWAAPGGALTITAGDNISAMTGDSAYLYYAVRTGNTTREIRRLTGTSASEAVVSRGTTNPASPFFGMTMMQSRLYGWTGRKLFEFDVAETVPLTYNSTYRKVYDTGVELVASAYGGSAQGSWWGDCTSTENSVVYFSGSEGDTTVYEYKNGVGRPIWHLPYGFTGKSIKVQNGILYIAGHWGGEGTANGFGAMYAMPLGTRREVFVGWFRKTQGTNLQMQEMANSYGDQILVSGAKSGRVFVFDAEFNSVSLLDDYSVAPVPTNWDSNHKIGDVLTIGPRRLVAFYNPGGTSGTTLEVLQYKNDEVSNRESVGTLSNTLDSGESDFEFPNEVKAVVGFHVTFKVTDATTTSGLLANQRITVKYQLDGGSAITAGTVTSASTPSGAKGRVWIGVSDGTTTRKCFRLRVQLLLDNNATTSVQQPVLYGCTVEAELLSYRETWDLVLRTKTEDKKNARPLHRSLAADVLRDNLEDLMTNKNVVTFLDGYREREVGTYTTHTVVVEQFSDTIERQAQGSVRVRLRSVPV